MDETPMNLRWSRTLAIVGAGIMVLLVSIFYASTDKTAIRQWLDILGFPGVWVGARLFRGAPLTRTSEVLFNLYLIACAALEGFLVGWCVDFIRKRKGGHAQTYDAQE
jgi:hypothetical protein